MSGYYFIIKNKKGKARQIHFSASFKQACYSEMCQLFHEQEKLHLPYVCTGFKASRPHRSKSLASNDENILQNILSRILKE